MICLLSQVFCDMTSDDGIGYTVVARFSDKTYFVLDEVNLNAENKIIVPGFVQSKSSKMPDSLINKLYTSQVKWTTTDNPTYSMYFQLACGQTYTTTGTDEIYSVIPKGTILRNSVR